MRYVSFGFVGEELAIFAGVAVPLGVCTTAALALRVAWSARSGDVLAASTLLAHRVLCVARRVVALFAPGRQIALHIALYRRTHVVLALFARIPLPTDPLLRQREVLAPMFAWTAHSFRVACLAVCRTLYARLQSIHF